MAGKFEDIFQRVFNAVNLARSKQGGGVLPKERLREIRSELGIAPEDWYPAVQRAKKMTPNLYELFEKAFAKAAADEEAPAPPEEPEAEAIDQADDAPTVLATVLAWLDKLGPADRKRVLATAICFYEIE